MKATLMASPKVKMISTNKLDVEIGGDTVSGSNIPKMETK